MENPVYKHMAHQMLFTALVQQDLIKHPRQIPKASTGLPVAIGCIFGSLTIKHTCCTPLKQHKSPDPQTQTQFYNSHPLYLSFHKHLIFCSTLALLSGKNGLVNEDQRNGSTKNIYSLANHGTLVLTTSTWIHPNHPPCYPFRPTKAICPPPI